jgi:hypothetical protein
MGRAGATAVSGPTGPLIDPRFLALDSIEECRGVPRSLGRSMRPPRSRFTSIAMCITYLIENGTTATFECRYSTCTMLSRAAAALEHRRVPVGGFGRWRGRTAPPLSPTNAKLNGRSTGRIRVSPERSPLVFTHLVRLGECFAFGACDRLAQE